MFRRTKLIKRSLVAALTVASVLGSVAISNASATTQRPASTAVMPGCAAKTNGPITTITLAGPNQYSTSGKSYGPAWDKLVSEFESCEPNVRLNILVLPISTFYETESTELSAGTAPALVFNQAAYQPYMVTNLDSWLNKPNPFNRDGKTWLQSFNKYFMQSDTVDIHGHHDWLPLTMSATALLYNKDIFAKVGIKPPVKFSQLITDCIRLRSKGYAGIALDDSDPWVSWTSNVIFEMILHRDFNQLNVFNSAGQPGTNTTLTQEDWAKAIMSGQITTSTPEVAEGLQLMKQVYNDCGTKNWSGIQSNSGSMSDPQDFITGKAAMSIGTSFAGGILGSVKFSYGTIPFPTITAQTSPLAVNYAARFGVSPYGSAFMIPSTTHGAQLKAAIEFLQFATSPTIDEELVQATSGVPSVNGAQIPKASSGFVRGAWGEPMEMSNPIGYAPAGQTLMSLYDGYFLGAKTLSQEESYLEGIWMSFYQTIAKNDGWCSLSWAKC